MKYYTNSKSKKAKGWVIAGSIVGVIAVFFLVINLIPPAKVVENNPFLVKEGELPMLAAHRGGSITSPENTLKAYESALNDYDVDIFETDLWLTKDGYVVLNHDSDINRCSDVEVITGSSESYKIADHTLDELQNFNMGYNFAGVDNSYPYRDLVTTTQEDRKDVIKQNDLSIVTINDLFDRYYDTNKDLLFIVEIKNGGEKGYQVADILDDLLTNTYPDYKDRVVIGTFHNEIENYLKEEHQTLHRGASTGVAAKFVITTLTFTNLFDFDDFTCLQLPLSMYGIDLTWDIYIQEAHERNAAVQYWTINEEDEMRKMIEKGCDAIMTDDPGLLREVLNSYK